MTHPFYLHTKKNKKHNNKKIKDWTLLIPLEGLFVVSHSTNGYLPNKSKQMKTYLRAGPALVPLQFILKGS